MAVSEKVCQDDLILYEILKNPELCYEFIANIDKLEWEEKIELTWYQKEFICDFNNYVSLSCGRAVGKCLDGDSRLLDTMTGEYRTVKDWYFSQGIGRIPVIQSETFQQKTEEPRILYNGKFPVLEVQLEKGFKTKVTHEHPFLTSHGWVKASDLRVGSYVAVPNDLEYFGNGVMDIDDLIYLAHFIAEGTYKTGGITTVEPEIIRWIYEYANRKGMVVNKNKLTYNFNGEYRLVLLENFGLRNCHSYNKFIPQEVFTLRRDQIALFLSILFSDDGWCTDSEVGYVTSSEQLARDIHHLLLRFGIVASLSKRKTNGRGAWSLSIKGKSNLEKFSEIGFILKRKRDKLNSVLDSLRSVHNTASQEIIPIPNYRDYRIIDKQKGRNPTTRPLDYYPTREKAKSVINKDPEFSKFENADIVWLKVKSVSDAGVRDTYSVECELSHTLVADDIYSHNTFTITGLIVWVLVNNIFPNDYIVYTVPNKVHLEPVWANLVRNFRSNSFLKQFLDVKAGINSSEFSIKLNNNAVLLCRIAGQSGTGANVIGLHSPFELLDESGYYPWGTWLELQPTLNTFTPGFRLMTSGVPTGMRENNVNYHTDMENSNYSKHKISALQNPRFSKEDEERAAEQYGGRDSEDYIHLVLGQHGRPVFSLFDRGAMQISNYPVYKLDLDGTKLFDNLAEYINRLSVFPGMPDKNMKVIFGIDLGYTEPTAIVILYLDSLGRLRFHGRIKMTKVNYFVQEKLIDWLDTKFNPIVIAVDEGSAGKAVIPRLQEHEDFLHKNYKKRLIPVNFSSQTVLGVDSDGNEIKSKTKPFAVSILQDYANNHKIIFSSTDLELVTELERMTYSKTQSGEIVYRTLTERGGKKGEDHFTSALLCGVLGYYLQNEQLVFKAQKQKLAGAAWFLGNLR
jgi:intein/homing endonuclease